ncbi:MAG TPA: hypothetical protein VNA25_04950 [Phycisphaerae bacterium]|nr:hypothetical protein [Phycisphaerae bacterium]
MFKPHRNEDETVRDRVERILQGAESYTFDTLVKLVSTAHDAVLHDLMPEESIPAMLNRVSTAYDSVACAMARLADEYHDHYVDETRKREGL